MKIEPVGPEAAAALADLHAAAFPRPWDAAAFGGLLAFPGALALTAEDAGFILLRRVLDEAEVLTLAVRPQARRRGVARALVETAAGLAARAGAATLWLEVAEDNAAALGLYAGCGFARTGVRPGYYPRAEGPAAAAVVMRRALAERA